MKRIIIAVFATFFMLSCSPGTEDIKVVEEYIQAVENLDYETMESLLHDNYLGLGPSFGDSIRKDEAVMNYKLAAQEIYESIKYNRSRNAVVIVPDGDDRGQWVSNWAELSIEYQRTDVPVTLWANSIYKIQDGKIIKTYTFYNEADAYEQLGFRF